jgi:Uncharacterized conserved protein
MIKIVAECYIRNEEVKTFKEVCSKLIDLTRKNQPGNIKYELFERNLEIDMFGIEKLDNMTMFSFIEEWKDLESLKIHCDSDYLAELLPQMERTFAKNMRLTVYKLVK